MMHLIVTLPSVTGRPNKVRRHNRLYEVSPIQKSGEPSVSAPSRKVWRRYVRRNVDRANLIYLQCSQRRALIPDRENRPSRPPVRVAQFALTFNSTICVPAKKRAWILNRIQQIVRLAGSQPSRDEIQSAAKRGPRILLLKSICPEISNWIFLIAPGWQVRLLI